MRLCPRHAKRFARAVAPILRNLPPLAGETGGSSSRRQPDGGDGGGSGECANDKLSMAQASLGAAAAAVVAAERSTAATATMLALRRPLEAFLRARVASSAPGRSTSSSPSAPAAATPRKRRRRSFGGGSKTGRAGDRSDGGGIGGGREDNDNNNLRPGAGIGEARSRGRVVGHDATQATSTTAVAAAAGPFPEFVEVLLPRCIVPLFEATSGGRKKTKVAAERRDKAREGEGGSAPQRQENHKKGLSCLEAVLDVCPLSGSGSTAAGAALDALRR